MSPVTFRPARRERVGLLCGIAGASGSGKTFSALRLARGLAGDKPFGFIDTENGRALHYADNFDFEHAVLDPPFRPERYVEAIQAAEAAGYPVIVVDSASHEYSGTDGLQDWHEEELTRMAGDNQGKRNALSAPAWNKPKTAHAKFVNDLLRVKAHLILCLRARQAIEMVEVEENGRKKTVVRPTQALDSFDGWLIETEHKRAPLAFELTCSFLLVPDRPGIPQPMKLPDPLRQLVPLDQPLSEETGRALGEWAAGNPDASKAARGRRRPAAEAQQSDAPALTTKLLDSAAKLEKREEFATAIAKHRGEHATDPAAHVEWLKRQLERVQAKVAEAADQDVEL